MERHFAELTVFIAKEFDTLVLEELKGAIQDANILLNLSPAEKSASGYGDRVREDVSVLRRLISQVASNGPGTLGYCFQAYGIVVALLHAAGNSAGEIALTRAAYARNPFQTLLEAPEGPLMQWRALQKIAADETAVLNDLQREYLIGVRCVQWSKSVYRRPAPGKPMDDGPIEVGDKKWTITGYFARLAGDVAQTALIADAIAERELGLSETVLANRAAVQAFAPALLLADPLVFVWKYAGQPEHGSAADVAAASQARVARARLASQRSTESRRLQPDLEALVTGVKAAFAL
jgi:hypothetical protein